VVVNHQVNRNKKETNHLVNQIRTMVNQERKKTAAKKKVKNQESTAANTSQENTVRVAVDHTNVQRHHRAQHPHRQPNDQLSSHQQHPRVCQRLRCPISLASLSFQRSHTRNQRNRIQNLKNRIKNLKKNRIRNQKRNRTLPNATIIIRNAKHLVRLSPVNVSIIANSVVIVQTNTTDANQNAKTARS